MRNSRPWILPVLCLLPALGCGGAQDDAFDLPACDQSVEEGQTKGTLCDVPDDQKEDSLTGAKGLSTAVDSADTAVWEVKNQWEDTSTAEARKAGLAWEANSGITWDEKFDRWVQSLPKIDGHETYYQTFEISTPWGRTLQAPLLECAEVAMFLRITFASWYNLPFFLEGTDAKGNRLYFGHFGARTAAGRYGTTPRFKSWYTDYTSRYDGTTWPSDAKLRERAIPGTSSELQPFLGDDAHAGAYFDELFLNKRVGYFLCLTLAYFGSVNLASSANTYHLKPETLKAGDLNIERWQRRGIGHVMVVKSVKPLEAGHLEAEIASGSMPRRQPKWETPAASKRYFTLEECGGPGTNSDGDAYYKLGGGVRRFRSAKSVNGRWTNVVLGIHASHWLADTDYAAIQARPATFETLLGEVSPEELRTSLLRTIEDNRAHLRQYPASCSARTRREGAFNELYALNQERFGISAADTDRQHRALEDYVFAELAYEQSKTCCWNSTTAAMYEIIMDYNEHHVGDGECREPVVFKAQGAGASEDGYGIFREHAISLGRGDEWVGWSEDEPCAQRGVRDDTESPHAWIPSCEALGGPVDGCPDGFAGNASQADAAEVAAGTYPGLRVCDGRSDWFHLPREAAVGQATVRIAFEHAQGDLDMKLHDADGQVLADSQGTQNTESISFYMSGERWVEVYGYSGAANTYELTVELP
ncbi:MAG TPA: hypothetical protein PK668_08820 [Myxococcota bacterium]|nr:hypothetical protein [Myxococcota bacterium]HRY92919.1 hypothetical protein [Myxococcota bacterium]HSA19862.1 hypothetical protein [Myxococcota bacterium]